MTTTSQDAVVVEETGLGKFQVEVRAGDAAFLADEPVAVGGLGSGPNPYDLLCAALGACTAMTLRLYAEQKVWRLTRAHVRVSHQKVAGRDTFRRELVLEGDLDDAQRRRLLEIAERCPVHRTLERGADIESALATAALADPSASGQHMGEMEKACA
jgi:putative redox protein